MKSNRTKFLLILVVLVAAMLACTTIPGITTDPTQPPVVQPTQPPVVQPTDTSPPPPPPPTSAPPAADILFEDDFSDSASGWDRYSDADGSTDYFNGSYRITVNKDTYFYWANPYRTFTDVVVEVQAQKTSTGDDIQYGIICRHSDVNNWYVLVVSGDGYAAIRKRYQGSDLTYIADWVQSSAINTGNTMNTLRAECIGSRLALYVNGQLVIEVNDADIPNGDVGLLAGTFSDLSVEVLFDNYVVTRP